MDSESAAISKTAASGALRGVISGHPTTSPIRLLQSDDREAIWQLLSNTGMFSEEEVQIALELVDAFLTRPDQRDYVIYVYQADRVLGYYCIGPTPATIGTFDLYWIAVDPSAQGRGIGAALQSHAEGLVRSLGGRLILAETSSQAKYKNTRKFYLHQGYAQVSRIRGYYSPDDDLVVFGKYLT